MPLPHATPAPRRPARPLRGILTALGAGAAIALLLGCTPADDAAPMLRPGDPDAKACQAQCDLLKTQCQQRQETREKECARDYTSAQADYAQCLASHARKCLAPYTCLGVDLSICEREYTPCIRACGTAAGPGQALPSAPATPPRAPADPKADPAR